MTRTLSIALVAALLLLPGITLAQQSDFAIKQDFESRYERITRFLDGAINTTELDTLKRVVDGLEIDFRPHTAFLDKAMYPSTFDQKMKALRLQYARTYDMLHVMETQGSQIALMEGTIAEMTVALDTLRGERDALFVELKQNRSSMVDLRETIRRLQAHLKANDQLLFAMVDSMFMPYGKDLAKVGDAQRSSLAARIEKANILTRVHDMASDNLRFLKATEFQAVDFASLIDGYQQFSSRWLGLSDKILAVSRAEAAAGTSGGTASPATGEGTGPGAKGVGAGHPAPTGQVDSLVIEWHAALQKAFWNALMKEFTAQDIPVTPFADAQSFSASIRAYVQELQTSEADPRIFVENVWKARIDREWKAALTRESVLGKDEYAALDALVSGLTPPAMDTRYLVYIAIIAVVAALLWWLLARKRRPAAPAPPAA
jgi:hypothetical protein